MTRQWARRDHAAERAAITAAIERVLSEVTPDSQPPTVTDLARAANLRRDYLYQHKDLVAEFKSNLAKKSGKSTRLMAVENELREEKEKAKSLRNQIAERDEEIRVLRLLLAETTLELDDLKSSVRRNQSAPPEGRRSLAAVRAPD